MTAMGKCYPHPKVIAEIQINSVVLQGYKPDNTTHTGPRAPRVATIHDVTKKPGRVLRRPSVVFHAYVSNYVNHSIISLKHIGPPSLEKGPIASGFQSLVFYR
jgi:hypothetical protein